jgi:hypothetical protein
MGFLSHGATFGLDLAADARIISIPPAGYADLNFQADILHHESGNEQRTLVHFDLGPAIDPARFFRLREPTP